MYYIARTSYTFLPCYITLPFLLHFFISNVFSTCIYIELVYINYIMSLTAYLKGVVLSLTINTALRPLNLGDVA